MGDAGRPHIQWMEGNDRAGGRAPDGRSQNLVRRDLDAGLENQNRRKHPVPRIGERFGELEVTGFLVGKRGGICSRGILVRCACGGPEYGASANNLRRGAATRCMFCAVRKSVETRKQYIGYREVVADDNLRTTLLGRINGLWRRCYQPVSKSYPAYGGRGIRVWWYEQFGIGAVRKRDKAVWRRKMLEYLVTLPGHDAPGLELDRIDNSRGYEPDNLRFVSRRQNANNRRTVWELEQRIRELEAEVAGLRSGQLRAA